MWMQKIYNKEKEKQFINMGFNKLLSRLLSQRNVEPNFVKEFVSSEYQNLSHPFSLYGVEKACGVFLEVVKKGGKVQLFVDYDFDGLGSGSMVKEICNAFNLKCDCMVASRLRHGYGLNKQSVNEIKGLKNKFDLLFILDSGTNNFKDIEEIKNHFGCKIIIIDHHEPSKEKLLHSTNADAIISWHFGGVCEMCTCGEVFQFVRGLHQFNKKIQPIEWLTMAACGTIADCSPIIKDNRIIVKNGLSSYAINHILASGLTALMKQSRINNPSLTQMDISFKIAPKINAVGRLSDAGDIYTLLIERDLGIATKIAEILVGFNDERKALQRRIEEEAIVCTESDSDNTTHGILIWCKGWHVGVVGIVASRLVEIYNKPVLVIGENNGVMKGSGRSVIGVNIKEILDLCPEIFVTYGGHAGAVGVTLKEEYKDDAARIFNEACKKYFKDNNITRKNCFYFDAKLSAKLICPETSKVFAETLYPYCDENNAEPIFMLPDAIIKTPTFKEDDKRTWKLMTFYAEREMSIPYPFKMFSPKWGSEIEGRKADIYFSFPQHYEIVPNKYSQFELMVTDIVFKD
jgi:single-stranded-DNA-specific exonuclease